MRSRCLSKSNKAYKYYSPKGISKEWMVKRNFINDMMESMVDHFEKYGSWETTIDRLDNSKGYSKENCRWATRDEQFLNMEHRKVLLASITPEERIRLNEEFEQVLNSPNPFKRRKKLKA